MRYAAQKFARNVSIGGALLVFLFRLDVRPAAVRLGRIRVDLGETLAAKLPPACEARSRFIFTAPPNAPTSW